MIHLPHHLFGGPLVVKVARLSPLLGIIILVTILESGPGSGAWDEIWRLFISIGLGSMVTLLGMIYHSIDRRVTVIEEKFLAREEFNIRHQEILDQLRRIETHLEKTDDRIHSRK